MEFFPPWFLLGKKEKEGGEKPRLRRLFAYLYEKPHSQADGYDAAFVSLTEFMAKFYRRFCSAYAFLGGGDELEVWSYVFVRVAAANGGVLDGAREPGELGAAMDYFFQCYRRDFDLRLHYLNRLLLEEGSDLQALFGSCLALAADERDMVEGFTRVMGDVVEEARDYFCVQSLHYLYRTLEVAMGEIYEFMPFYDGKRELASLPEWRLEEVKENPERYCLVIYVISAPQTESPYIVTY